MHAQQTIENRPRSRRVALVAPEGQYVAPSDFRAAMRRLASSVHVLTVADEGCWFGITVTAVTSLTADPPALLICVNQSSSIHHQLERSEQICLNALSSTQEDIARQFSDRTLSHLRFSQGDWTESRGSPVLRDAAASFSCTVQRVVTFGTHTILLVSVEDARSNASVAPLTYYDGGYCQPEPVTPTIASLGAGAI